MTVTAPAPTKVPRVALVVAVTIVLALGLVVAGLWASRPAPVSPPTQSDVQQTFLNMVYPSPTDSASAKLALVQGERACRIMNTGSAARAAYRLAVGSLMAEQISPSRAALIAHSALVSGMCTER